MEGKLFKNDINDCISNLENHVHGVFASVRVPGDDFVYCPSSELFSKLDDYCDELTLSEVRPPLLIKGDSGTGKSALLANWLHRREHNYTSRTDEFIFWHAVGCSRPSLNVNHLLRRLISGLKVRFELARQIPRAQERLSWELPRFLDLASKKGKIVIIIDGIHQLKTNDGLEDNLSWLPLELPPNVRMILSVTAPAEEFRLNEEEPKNDGVPTFTPFRAGKQDPVNAEILSESSPGKGRKNRVLAELERRKIPSITVRSLERSVSKALINAYIESTISSDAAAVATGPYLGAFFDPTMGRSVPSNSEITYGFLLFESQITMLLDHPLGGNPQFLRLFLKNLHFLCRRGYSLWSVFEDWIQASSIEDLLSRILKSCEIGFKRTRESSQRDSDLTIAAGGVAALKALYSWHPAFKDKNSLAEESVSGGNSLVETNMDNGMSQKMNVNVDQSSASKQMGGSASVGGGPDPPEEVGLKENKTLSSQVMHNLGDQESVAVERLAQRQLQKAVIEVRKIAEENWNFKDSSYKSKLIDNVVLKISSSMQHTTENPAMLSEEQYENLEARMRAMSADSLSTVSANPVPAFESETNNNSDDEESWEENSQVSNAPSRNKQLFIESADNVSTPKQSGSGFRGTPTLGNENHPFSHEKHSSSKPGTAQNAVHAHPASDPSEGFFSLPLYMRGGTSTAGFGDILGNALSLLYVARQGLKEQELWKILDYLQVKAKHQKEFSKEKRKLLRDRKAMMRRNAESILKDQALLEVVLRAEDLGHSGYLSFDLFYQCLKKFVSTLEKEDLTTIFDLIIANIPQHLLDSDGTKFLDGENNSYVFYDKFFSFLSKIYRKFHSRSTNSKFSDKNIALQEEEEGWKDQFDDDYENFDLENKGSNEAEVATELAMGITEDEMTAQQRQESQERNQIASLGPVVEEMMLNVLCALGVLYSPENKVLILPCDLELFRQTIFDRYILPRGGGTIQYWHNLIIQYFKTQPNSLRKCEEMPWHLKICRKWTSLKDSLVDLKTFDLMFNNDLRDELMEYWLLLTEGPLFVTDQSSSGGQKSVSDKNSLFRTGTTAKKSIEEDNDDNYSTFSHILREIDECIATRLSIKDIRKKTLKYQMQPFDVVEELNHSIENWVTAERPSPFLIHRTISQIASFLLEFAKQTKSCPQFRRLGIDIEVLEQFGVSLTELKSAIAFQNSTHPSHHHHPNELEDSPHKSDGKAKTPEKKYFDGLSKKEPEKFPTPQMVASNFYLYLRWIWIQFPWLALHLAATVNSPTTGAGDHFDTEYLKTISNIEGDGAGNDDALAAQGIHDPAKHLLRVWNVKKADPSVQVFANSLNRKLAAIKPRTSLTTSLERNVNVSYNNLCDELSKPSHIAQLRLGLGFTQRDKYRRNFQDEVDANKNIPYSYHGVRAMKTGSLFPSYHSFIKEKNKKQIESDFMMESDMDGLKKSKSKKGGFGEDDQVFNTNKKKKKQEKFDLDAALKKITSSTNDGNAASTFFLTELDDEIRRITSEEYLQSHRVERGGLIQDEFDLEYETYLDRISRMKSIWNKLLIIQREKERIITELENAIVLRQESDTILINEVQSGEALIKSLNERNITMEKNLREAIILEDGYKDLIKSLKLNPPYIESHVQSLEVEVSLAERQFSDLCQQRAKLYQESVKLEEVKKKHLVEKISYFKNARQEIQAKKKAILKEIKHLKDSLGRHGNSNGITLVPVSTPSKEPRKSIRNGQNNRRGQRNSTRKQQPNRRRGNHSPTASDNENEIINSSDSDSSDNQENSEIHLTKPVMHFINAIVRKVTYNEPIIKETDATVLDVKKRAAIVKTNEDEDEDDDELIDGLENETTPNGNPNATNLTPHSASGKRRGRATINQGHNHGDNKLSDGDSITSGNSVTRFVSNKVLPIKKRLTVDQIHKLRSVVKMLFAGGTNKDLNNPQPNSDLPTTKDSFKTQIQKAVHLIFQKTESNTYEEFIERYMQDQQLLEQLRSQQVLVDSRLSQLRTEHAELYAVWSDISFLAEESNTANVGTTNSNQDDNSDRYLDNQLFVKEVRMHHYQRLGENSVHTIGEARVAVSHLMRLLIINSKLLSNLPRSPPPDLNSDADLTACLSWCEDRLIALNEALTMDANRPNNTEENKPIAQRQTELAALVHTMNHENKKNRLNSSLKNQKKQQGAMSKGVINSLDRDAFVSSPRGVMIIPAGKIDKAYDSKVSKLISERDKHAEALEGQNFYSRDVKASNEVQRFLNDGLDTKSTKNMSRIAKQLVNKRSGRTASYGLVLEELLQSRGQTYELPGPTIKARAKSPTKSSKRKEGSASPTNSAAGRSEDPADTLKTPKAKVESISEKF